MIIRRGDKNERPTPVRRVFYVGLAGLLIAGLLNAGSILERSKQKPFGWERDVWVALWTPVETISHLLFLDQPHAWITDAIGRGGGVADDFVFPPPDSNSPGATPVATGTAAPEEVTPTPTPAPVRVPTAEEPLRLWVGGDSQAQVFGESMVSMANSTGVIEPHLDYRISSGLTRPDYFNWPAHLLSEAETRQPDVMVIVFGGNDSQGIQTDDGDIYQPGEPGWADEYRRRVAGTMDLLEGQGRLQVWIGQPIAADPGYSERMAELNTIFREEAERREGVLFFDSWDLFADESGGYNAYLTDDNGEVQNMRQADGIHLTRAGGDRLASAVLDAIGDEINIGPPYSE